MTLPYLHVPPWPFVLAIAAGACVVAGWRYLLRECSD